VYSLKASIGDRIGLQKDLLTALLSGTLQRCIWEFPEQPSTDPRQALASATGLVVHSS